MSLSVKSFLTELKYQLNTGIFKSPIKFVTGNQSADMDSVISAISHSYFQYIFDPSTTFLPLINIPKSEFVLRRDIELLLKSYSIDGENLFFIEDFVKLTANESIVEIVLVDHCNIQGEELNVCLKNDKLRVVGIIDHHADEDVFLDAKPRIIQSNGSCSSLVFNYWYNQFNNKSVFQNNEMINILLGPLLIDTSNMTQKVEKNDIIAFEKYNQILNVNQNSKIFNCLITRDTKLDHLELYNQLKKAKKDLDGFKFYDILRKDYKQFDFKGTVIGFSSIGKSINWVVKKYDEQEIKNTLDSILQDLKLNVLVITTSYTKKENGEYTREFAYYYKDSRFEKLSELAPELDLNLDIYHGDNVSRKVKSIKNFKVFNQVNIKASRKQVVPIVKDCVESHLL